MGTRLTDAGLIVQLHHPDGRLAGDPLVAKYAQIRGIRRPDINDLEGEEHDHPGSEHWLTLVAAADSDERLTAILADANTSDGDCFTSCSSRRVRVELDIGKRQSFPNAITIASGPVVSIDPQHPNVHVVHVRVLPEGTRMDDQHPLIDEFTGGSRLLQVAITSRKRPLATDRPRRKRQRSK